MNTEDRITRAIIQIQRRNPFFAYMSLYLKISETENLPDYAGMGVNAKGELVYKKEFVDSLDDKELIGVLIHEILHLTLLHLTRRNNRHAEAWNVACDICVNQIVKDNNYHLPEGCVVSDRNNEIVIGKKTIKDTDKKSAEEIFDELPFEEEKGGCGSGSGGYDFTDGEGEKYEQFDEHQETKNLTPEEKRRIEEEWKDKISEAYVASKMKGDVPLGIERLIGKLHEQKVNWKVLLQRFITNSIPQDYTYAKPNKKSVSAGYYMPDTKKERIEVLVGIDLSGSIGKEEMTDFISEIVGMAKTYREKISFRILTHDTEVCDDYKVENGNIDKIMKLEFHGGGGTSHIPIFHYINEKHKDTKLAIFFTDGESDIESIKMNEYKFKKLFLISKEGKTELNIKEKIIKL